MRKSELTELKKFVKEVSKKVKKENTTASVGAYATPKAFVGDPDAEGSKAALDASTAYHVKPSKKKKFFIGHKDQGKHLSDIKEANYRQFKEDASVPNHKKINQAILEINRKISEINKLFDHSVKLKTEAQVGDEKLWKRTNEALLKIHKRLNEATKRIKEVANLKEVESNSIKSKFLKILSKAGIAFDENAFEMAKQGNVYNIDVQINGEPYAFDLENDILTYQGFDKEVDLGNINRELDVVSRLKSIF